MNRTKNTQLNTEQSQEEHIHKFTMQEFSSTVSFSPSFSVYASADANLDEAAVRAIRDTQSYYSVKVDDDRYAEFEFETSPLHEESFHFPTTFKLSLEEEEESDVAADRITSKNLFYGGWNIDQSLSSPSQSESDDLEDFSSSSYYCFWSPIRSPARGDNTKSKSSNAPRRCRIKDFLRRSHSDGSVSTEPKRCRFKDLLRRSHSDAGASKSSSGKSSPVMTEKKQTAAYKTTNIRKTYLPYKQDLIGVFAGRSRFRR